MVDSFTAIIVLCMIIPLIFLLIHGLKRFHTKPFLNHDLVFLSQLSLGGKERLILLKVKDNHMLIGVTNHQISLLHTFDITNQQNIQSS